MNKQESIFNFEQLLRQVYKNDSRGREICILIDTFVHKDSLGVSVRTQNICT